MRSEPIGCISRPHGLVTKTAGGIPDVSGRAWWLSAAALLLLLTVAALGVAVTLVNPNDYKLQIDRGHGRDTGQPARRHAP